MTNYRNTQRTVSDTIDVGGTLITATLQWREDKDGSQETDVLIEIEGHVHIFPQVEDPAMFANLFVTLIEMLQTESQEAMA